MVGAISGASARSEKVSGVILALSIQPFVKLIGFDEWGIYVSTDGVIYVSAIVF